MPDLDIFGRPRTVSSTSSVLPVGLAPLLLELRWLLWRYVERAGKEPTKVPYQAADPRREARSNDPATWSDFETAHRQRHLADGVGFALTGFEIGAFDLDNCRDPKTGEIADWAWKLVREAGSYAEVSISGTGLRIIGYASGPKIHRQQKLNGLELETYRRAERYIVITGNVLAGFDKLRDINDLMDRTVARIDAEKKATKTAAHRKQKPVDFEKLPAKLRKLITDGVEEGKRSDTFHHVCGWLADLGHDADAVEALLDQHPGGIAEKYDGRLRQEIDRVWPKLTIKAPPAEWLSLCIRDDKGIVPNVANALLALRNAPEFADVFAHDAMADLPMLSASIPRWGENPEQIDPRPVTDVDVHRLQAWLQHAGILRLGKEAVHQAVDVRAGERAYHPIRLYLDSLIWDRKPRIDRWLTDFLGAESTPYASAVGAMFLIAMVARVRQPGVKCDYMLVLEGEQGLSKSKACSILAGDWYSDALPDLMFQKDVSAHLAGKWLVEIGEMASLSRSEVDELKAFCTRAVERYRPPYGRKEVIQPRQCVFIGTTNRSTYLRDETGGRRFWPVKVGAIDADGLAANRDQLFAEAVHCYGAGRRWWPDADFEREQIKPQQEARFEFDAWEDPINAYLEAHDKVTVSAIAHHALRMETGRIGTSDQRRIAAVLERRGWRRGPRSGAEGTRWWVPPLRSAAE